MEVGPQMRDTQKRSPVPDSSRLAFEIGVPSAEKIVTEADILTSHGVCLPDKLTVQKGFTEFSQKAKRD